MNCLFCHQDSSSSKSVEHIIPESLGNKEHILSKGFVCDSCNQYFAIKIEKPMLEQPYFRFARNRIGIENKKRTIPTVEIIMLNPDPKKIEFANDGNRQFGLIIPEGKHRDEYFGSTSGKLIIPVLGEPEGKSPVISKFLAKAANEAIVLRIIQSGIILTDILVEPSLEPIKQYARFGRTIKFWPYHQRRLYSEDLRFSNRKMESSDYEILHEWTFLHIDEFNLYFILCILGTEYAINMITPSVDSYEKWLTINNNASALNDTDETKLQ